MHGAQGGGGGDVKTLEAVGSAAAATATAWFFQVLLHDRTQAKQGQMGHTPGDVRESRTRLVAGVFSLVSEKEGVIAATKTLHDPQLPSVCQACRGSDQGKRHRRGKHENSSCSRGGGEGWRGKNYQNDLRAGVMCACAALNSRGCERGGERGGRACAAWRASFSIGGRRSRRNSPHGRRRWRFFVLRATGSSNRAQGVRVGC